MPFEPLTPNGGTIITGKASIALARLFTLRSALTLEVKGMRVSRRSVYAIIKREFSLKGNKARVLAQFNAIVEQAKIDHDAAEAREAE